MSTIRLTPTSGQPGTRVQVSGSQFTPRSPVEVLLNGQVRATCMSDAGGNISTTFTVPHDPAGAVTIRTAIASSAAAPFQILPIPPPPVQQSIRLIEWVPFKDAVSWQDSDLAKLATMNVGGLMLAGQILPGIGGNAADWVIPPNFAARCRAHGLTKLYLSWFTLDYNTPRCPYGEWFASWTTALAAIGQIAAIAKAAGFDGVGFDHEPYPGVGNGRYTWDWNYPGNTHTQAEVRAAARVRGQQVMQQIVAAFPGATIVSYHDYFGDTKDYGFQALTQHVVNGKALDAFATETVLDDYYDGMTSTPGWSSFSIADASFYHGAGLSGWTDLAAMQMNRAGTLAYLARRLTHGAANIGVTPFVWLPPTNGDGSAWSKPMLPDQALTVAQAAHATAMGDLVFAYDYGDLLDFDPNDFSTSDGRITHGKYGPAFAAMVGK